MNSKQISGLGWWSSFIAAVLFAGIVQDGLSLLVFPVFRAVWYIFIDREANHVDK